MPRTIRVEYPGAIYHVMIRLRWGSDAMNRGDRREDIFEDDEDRQRFLETLTEACQKIDWQVHAHPRASGVVAAPPRPEAVGCTRRPIAPENMTIS